MPTPSGLSSASRSAARTSPASRSTADSPSARSQSRRRQRARSVATAHAGRGSLAGRTRPRARSSPRSTPLDVSVSAVGATISAVCSSGSGTVDVALRGRRVRGLEVDQAPVDVDREDLARDLPFARGQELRRARVGGAEQRDVVVPLRRRDNVEIRRLSAGRQFRSNRIDSLGLQQTISMYAQDLG